MGTSNLIYQHLEAVEALSRGDADMYAEAFYEDISQGINTVEQTLLQRE